MFQQRHAIKPLEIHHHSLKFKNSKSFAYISRLLIVMLIQTLLWPFVTWAFEPSTYMGKSMLQGSEQAWQIPKDLGRVTNTSASYKKLVFHIQDLHCNYHIQKNIAHIIDQLAEEKGVDLVAIEGASQPINVTKLSTFPQMDVKQDVADYLLKQGKLSGAEYYAAVGQHPVRLQGIESSELYLDNYASILKLLKDENEGHVMDLYSAFEKSKSAICSLDLLKLDHIKSTMRSGQLSFYKYCVVVYEMAMQKKVSTEPFPELLHYLDGRQASLPVDTDTESLIKEVALLEKKVRRKLYSRKAEEELDDFFRRLDIIESLITISATAEQVEEVRLHRDRFHVGLFLKFLEHYSVDALSDLSQDIYNLDNSISEALHFYQTADDRSEAFVANTIQLLQEANKRYVILITGGYHTEKVLSALREQGYGYASIRPRLVDVEVANPYYRLLRKRKSDLEQMIASAPNHLALEPYFVQYPNRRTIIDETSLPLNKQHDYQMLELMLKVTTAKSQMNARELSVNQLEQAYHEVLEKYPANSGTVELDFKGAQKMGQSIILPVQDKSLFAVIQPVKKTSVLRDQVLEHMEQGAVAVDFYHQANWKKATKVLRKQSKGKMAGFSSRDGTTDGSYGGKKNPLPVIGHVVSTSFRRWFRARAPGQKDGRQSSARGKGKPQHTTVVDKYDDAMRAEYEALQKRSRSEFKLWPIFGELLSDLKLAIGMVPVLIHIGGGAQSASIGSTFGMLGWVLAALAGFTVLSNFIVTMIRERRLWRPAEMAKGLWNEINGLKESVLSSMKTFTKNRKKAPVATILTVLLFVAARALDYSTQVLSLGTVNAVVGFALLGGAIVMLCLSLLKHSKVRSEWMEGMISKGIRIVCAVVLIEVCKFPAGFFIALFLGSTALSNQTTWVSLKMLKKVIGVLSFTQFFLNAMDWFQRKNKIAARKRIKYGESGTVLSRLKDSFGKGQALRQILMLFVYSSILLITFYVNLPAQFMVVTQLITLLLMIKQWVVFAKNPKVNQNIKITTLASLLPVVLVVFSMGLSFGLTAINSNWPHLIPTSVNIHLMNLQTALQSVKSLYHELVVYVSFIYTLLGFSGILKDQDKVSQVSEAAPERLATLQRLVDHHIRKSSQLLHFDEKIDRRVLSRICQVKKVITVPQNGQPSWMVQPLREGYFSLDGEIYFRRRLFNMMSDQTIAAMILREGLIQSGLPLHRVHELIQEITKINPKQLATIGKEVLEAGNKMEGEVAAAFELGKDAGHTVQRARYLRKVLENRYQVRFAIKHDSYSKEFNGRWDVINEKMMILIKHGLEPHPYFLRYSKQRIESAAKYLYQRKKSGDNLTLKTYKEALWATNETQLNLTKKQLLKRYEQQALENEDEMDAIMESFHDGEAANRFDHVARTPGQRLWYPVRLLFYRQPKHVLEAWQLRQPWRGIMILAIGFCRISKIRPLMSREQRARYPQETIKQKKRVLRRYGLEPLPFMMAFKIRRIKRAADYIYLRRDAGAVLTPSLYLEAILATRKPGKGLDLQLRKALRLGQEKDTELIDNPFELETRFIIKAKAKAPWYRFLALRAFIRWLPAFVRNYFDCYWIKHEAYPYLLHLLKKDDSLLAQQLKEQNSRIGQLYLRMAQYQGEEKQQLEFVRELIQVLTQMDGAEDQLKSLQSLSRISKNIPALKGTTIGTWSRKAGYVGRQSVIVPEMMLKTGSRSMLGALEDMLYYLPAYFDLEIKEHWPRRKNRNTSVAA